MLLVQTLQSSIDLDKISASQQLSALLKLTKAFCLFKILLGLAVAVGKGNMSFCLTKCGLEAPVELEALLFAEVGSPCSLSPLFFCAKILLNIFKGDLSSWGGSYTTIAVSVTGVFFLLPFLLFWSLLSHQVKRSWPGVLPKLALPLCWPFSSTWPAESNWSWGFSVERQQLEVENQLCRGTGYQASWNSLTCVHSFASSQDTSSILKMQRCNLAQSSKLSWKSHRAVTTKRHLVLFSNHDLFLPWPISRGPMILPLSTNHWTLFASLPPQHRGLELVFLSTCAKKGWEVTKVLVRVFLLNVCKLMNMMKMRFNSSCFEILCLEAVLFMWMFPLKMFHTHWMCTCLHISHWKHRSKLSLPVDLCESNLRLVWTLHTSHGPAFWQVQGKHHHRTTFTLSMLQ